MTLFRTKLCIEFWSSLALLLRKEIDKVLTSSWLEIEIFVKLLERCVVEHYEFMAHK